MRRWREPTSVGAASLARGDRGDLRRRTGGLPPGGEPATGTRLGAATHRMDQRRTGCRREHAVRGDAARYDAGPLIVAAGGVVLRRAWLLGAATMGAGFAAWSGAKGSNGSSSVTGHPPICPRSWSVRATVRAGIRLRHCAVAASAALIAMAALSSRRRWAPPMLAGVVGPARIVHGVHLPADVVRLDPPIGSCWSVAWGGGLACRRANRSRVVLGARWSGWSWWFVLSVLGGVCGALVRRA